LRSFRFATRASTGSNIPVGPDIKFVPVEGDAALADGNFGQCGAHLDVKAIAIHAEVGRRIAITDKARRDHLCLTRTNV
jgi:hypothetical protein